MFITTGADIHHVRCVYTTTLILAVIYVDGNEKREAMEKPLVVVFARDLLTTRKIRNNTKAAL